MEKKQNGIVTLNQSFPEKNIEVNVEEAVTANLKEGKEIIVAKLENDSYFIGIKGFSDNDIALEISDVTFGALLSTTLLFAKAGGYSDKLFEAFLNEFVSYDLTDNIKAYLDKEATGQ